MATFGQRLRQLREERGLSQYDVAQIAGIPRSTYGNYESETRESTFKQAIWFADFFGVTLDYLFGRTDHRTGSAVKSSGQPAMFPPSAPVPLEWARMASKFIERGYSPEVLDAALNLLDTAQKRTS